MPRQKGFKHSPETIARMRQAKLGKKVPFLVRRKISLSLKGRVVAPFDDAHKANLSQALKGRKGSMLGKHHTTTTKKKISLSQKGRKKSLEQSLKNRAGHLQTSTIITYPRQGIGQLEIRLARERDSRTCLICGNTLDQIDVHHIIPVRRIPVAERKPDLTNVLCLCRKHHSWADHNLDESIVFLRNLLSKQYGYAY